MFVVMKWKTKEKRYLVNVFLIMCVWVHGVMVWTHLDCMVRGTHKEQRLRLILDKLLRKVYVLGGGSGHGRGHGRHHHRTVAPPPHGGYRTVGSFEWLWIFDDDNWRRRRMIVCVGFDLECVFVCVQQPNNDEDGVFLFFIFFNWARFVKCDIGPTLVF